MKFFASLSVFLFSIFSVVKAMEEQSHYYLDILPPELTEMVIKELVDPYMTLAQAGKQLFRQKKK